MRIITVGEMVCVKSGRGWRHGQAVVAFGLGGGASSYVRIKTGDLTRSTATYHTFVPTDQCEVCRRAKGATEPAATDTCGRGDSWGIVAIPTLPVLRPFDARSGRGCEKSLT